MKNVRKLLRNKLFEMSIGFIFILTLSACGVLDQNPIESEVKITDAYWEIVE